MRYSITKISEKNSVLKGYIMMKTILITGGAGFIGSNFVPYFCKKYPNYRIINMDKLTYAGSLDNLKECLHMPNHIFVKGDICDKNLIEKLFREYDIRGVVHLAAESHVDTSIQNPTPFIQSNIVGTFNLIDTAYHHWMEAPNKVKIGYEECRFYHISTDEVYGSLGSEGYFTENTPYAPNNPYSASKAGSDFIVRAYHHTYGMNITTSNCSNNYGPKQHSEKLIPLIIKQALSEQPITIHGTGKNIRDWLYVLDHCKAIDLIFHNGKSGETYNVGAQNEHDNITTMQSVCTILDMKRPRLNNQKYAELLTFIPDRPGNDFRYAIDSTKLQTQLGWRPQESFKTGLIKTVDWYLENIYNTPED